MATVLMPLPESDFDPTEAAVSWMMLGRPGHRVQFATPTGRVARGDDMMLSGRGLDPWGFVPACPTSSVSAASSAPTIAVVTRTRAWSAPAIPPPRRLGHGRSRRGGRPLLPGGHRARGMRSYLESPTLFEVVADAFSREIPVAPVCHGVLLTAARTSDPNRPLRTPRPPHHRPHLVPRAAGVADCPSHPFLGPRLLPDLPRTTGPAPGVHVRAAGGHPRSLARAEDFCDVDPSAADAATKRSGRVRDNPHDDRPAFVVRDGNYLSARWPGDVHTFAKAFAEMLGD